MNEINNSNNFNDLADGIDLLELLRILWRGKWIIISFTAFVSTIGVIYSLLLPNIYESKALLAPTSPSKSISAALRNYTGLAGLGLPLPASDEGSNSAKAIQKIHTLSFFENNILTNIYLPNLMAVDSWDSKTNSLVYNESIYNTSNKTWIGEYSDPKQSRPSAQKSFRVFKGNHLKFSEDKASGFITLSIKHQSPLVAKQWVELIVSQINNFYRNIDKSESEKAVSYLNQQILMTDLSEIKQVLAQLLQEETKKLVLIEANESYVFDYIDPPALMEQKSEPNRALICIIFALLGSLLSIVFVLLRHYLFSVNFDEL